MPDFDKVKNLALEKGFTSCAQLNISTLDFMQEVRDMCNPTQCNSYGKSWSCPPACPTLEEMRERIKSYSNGILVQTVGDIEDSYDWEGIMEAGALHKKNFMALWESLEDDYTSVLAMGAGACMLCETCTYPDSPCRFPDKMSPSMEACGLFVSKVCTDNNLPYNYGQDHITFNSCFLLSD